tara:strand:- start:678 stop:1160 length:483 start_codon:yes stop_codon:yes gene_type:complete
MKSTSFKVCFLIVVIGALILRWADNPPPGIIAFELSRTIENANKMVAQWETLDAIPLKKFSLLFDYVFIFGYAGALFVILQEWWKKTGTQWIYYLSFLPVLAGILDGIENLGLLQIVYGSGTQFAASLAFYCASTKFILLLPSLMFSVYYLYVKWRASIH